MNCKKCGSQINIDSKYCNMCGAKVENNLEKDNQRVELTSNTETINTVNSISPSSEANQIENQKPIIEQNNEQKSLESKETVLSSEQSINENEDSLLLPNEKPSTPVVETQTPTNETQSVVNNNATNIQNSSVNPTMVQDNQSAINTQIKNSIPINNQISTNMNNNDKSKKKLFIGLIIGVVAFVFIVGLIIIFTLMMRIKFNYTLNSNATPKHIVENRSTTSPTITTRKIDSNDSINVFDAILKLYNGEEPTNKDYNQVVALIGDGVKDENSSLPKYIWKQDENTELSIIFYTSGENYIQEVNIDYNRDDLKESGVIFSGAQAISDNINKQIPVYYDDIKTSFGREGHLYAFNNEYYKYVWVNEDGGYVEARFSIKTNQCVYFTGRI